MPLDFVANLKLPYKIVSPQLDTQTVLFHLYIQQI